MKDNSEVLSAAKSGAALTDGRALIRQAIMPRHITELRASLFVGKRIHVPGEYYNFDPDARKVRTVAVEVEAIYPYIVLVSNGKIRKGVPYASVIQASGRYGGEP